MPAPRASGAGARRQVGNLVPPFDGHWGQPPVLDQLGHPRCRLFGPDPEVVGQVGHGPHSEAPGRQQEQLALRVLGGWHRQAGHRRWDHPLGQVVDALEVRGPPRGERAVPE